MTDQEEIQELTLRVKAQIHRLRESVERLESTNNHSFLKQEAVFTQQSADGLRVMLDLAEECLRRAQMLGKE